jgi:peroxiredoxin
MALIDDNSSVLQIGDPMPHFRLPDTRGDMVDSKRFAQSVIIVIFTCNHCPYAQAYEDRILELDKEFFEEDNVRFVLINSNDATDYPEDSLEGMKRKAAEKKYPFRYCHDETQEVAKAYGALCTPHCFVFDDQRRLRYKGRIDDNWKDPSAVTERNLRDAIEALEYDKEPPKTEANAIGCSIKWKA